MTNIIYIINQEINYNKILKKLIPKLQNKI